MADNVLEAAVETTQVAPDYSAELAQQMAISLNGGMLPQQTADTQAADTTQSPDTTVQAADTAIDPFSLFKEKFGIETPEAAIQEFESLRAFKAQPTIPEFIIPDDESGALLRAIQAGKKEDVWRFLDHEMRIDRLVNAEVNKDTAAEIVKLGMQLKYKDLTPDELNYQYNKQFAIPAQPKQREDEEDGEYQERLSVWQDQATDKQMELMIAAKIAKPELQGAKGKFIIPEIETQADEGYVQYQKMLEDQARQDAEVKEAYKKFTPQAIETKIAFKDEANKIDFQFQFQPNPEKFAKAVELASDANQFWDLFKKPDGNPDRERFLDMIYFALDKENYLTSALSQSKNAAIKATLPDNTQGGMIRQITQTQESSELDQQMRMSLKGYGPF